MAKRGRKPKDKKNYFCVNEEDAIIEYLQETDLDKKNKIFNEILYPALTKMIESIIRRYKLFVPDEEFEQNFSDTISYLLTKISNFKPIIIGYTELQDDEDISGIYFTEIPYEELKKKIKNATNEDPDFVKTIVPNNENNECPEDEIDGKTKYYKKEEHHYKAYSYCGTICKNYLMFKCSQYTKNKQRNIQYDDIYDEIENDMKYTTSKDDGYDLAAKLVIDTSNKIEEMIENRDEHMLTDEEITVGKALINLLRNWEEVLPYNGSNKLQKNSVLYFLREETMMSTKEVRAYMKKYKAIYYALKTLQIE